MHYVSKDFTINNMQKKTELKRVLKFFLLILILLILTILQISINIWWKKQNIKLMFGTIKKNYNIIK